MHEKKEVRLLMTAMVLVLEKPLKAGPFYMIFQNLTNWSAVAVHEYKEVTLLMMVTVLVPQNLLKLGLFS